MALIHSLVELQTLAASFLKTFRPLKDRAALVGLSGNLGAGKTAFAKALAVELGVIDTVTSPTFVLEKIYKTSRGPFTHLIHLDAYRLEGSDELRALGWETLIQDPRNLVVVEWPERIEDVFPKDAKTIHFRFINETTREIDV